MYKNKVTETNLVILQRHTMQEKALSVGSNLTTPSPSPSPHWSPISILLPISSPSNFFFFIRFSFQAAPPLKPLDPIIHRGFSLMHHSWFCSLMHSISLFSLPSQPHHQIFIIGFYVVLQPQPLPPLVLSWFLLLLSTFLPHSNFILWPLTSNQLFQRILLCTHSPISLSFPFPLLSLFPLYCLPHSAPPPLPYHPTWPSYFSSSLSLSCSLCASLRWVTEC